MLDSKLDTKGIERPSVIKGVRHFDTRKDAMLYASLKYGVEMKYHNEIPGFMRAEYKGSKFNREEGKMIVAITPAGEWADDHDVLDIYREWFEGEGEELKQELLEFVTYADAYCYEYMHNREYNFIETV